VDLDALPVPARRRLALGRYRALNMPVSMTTSRGCPHGCIFCVGRKMVGPRVRYRSAARVVDELASLAGLGFPQINLADDLFTANRDHCLAVCDGVRQRGLQVGWTSFARVDTVSPDLLEAMRSAGCTAVSFGVESGNADMLRRIRKGITLDQVVAAVGMCTDAGVTPHASFVLGLPGETPETLADTLAFGQRLEALGVSYGFHVLAPFPGTVVRDRIDRYDLEVLTDDWSRYHANRAVVETAGVKKACMDAIVASWEQRFEAWLGDLKRKREAGGADPAEIRPLENLERTVLIYDLMMTAALEEKGRWPVTDPPPSRDRALGTLAGRVAAKVSHPVPAIRAALDRAEKEGNLTGRIRNGEISWHWVDRLPVP
jgi:anaerobic magnesium-protoporphyrin IX monomethyl ester cyclase